MIQTHTILKIKDHYILLGIASLELNSSVREKQLKFDKIRFVALALPVRMRCKRNCPQKSLLKKISPI